MKQEYLISYTFIQNFGQVYADQQVSLEKADLEFIKVIRKHLANNHNIEDSSKIVILNIINLNKLIE